MPLFVSGFLNYTVFGSLMRPSTEQVFKCFCKDAKTISFLMLRQTPSLDGFLTRSREGVKNKHTSGRLGYALFRKISIKQINKGEKIKRECSRSAR